MYQQEGRRGYELKYVIMLNIEQVAAERKDAGA